MIGPRASVAAIPQTDHDLDHLPQSFCENVLRKSAFLPHKKKVNSLIIKILVCLRLGVNKNLAGDVSNIEGGERGDVRQQDKKKKSKKIHPTVS